MCIWQLTADEVSIAMQLEEEVISPLSYCGEGNFCPRTWSRLTGQLTPDQEPCRAVAMHGCIGVLHPSQMFTLAGHQLRPSHIHSHEDRLPHEQLSQ